MKQTGKEFLAGINAVSSERLRAKLAAALRAGVDVEKLLDETTRAAMA